MEDDLALPHFLSTTSIESPFFTPPFGHMVSVDPSEAEAKKRNDRKKSEVVFIIDFSSVLIQKILIDVVLSIIMPDILSERNTEENLETSIILNAPFAASFLEINLKI